MLDLISPLTMKIRKNIIRFKMYFQEYNIIMDSTRHIEAELIKLINQLNSILHSEYCENDPRSAWMIKSLICKYHHIQGRVTGLRTQIYFAFCQLRFNDAIPYIRELMKLGEDIIDAISVRRNALFISPTHELERYIRKNNLVLNAIIETMKLDNNYNRYKAYYNAIDPMLYHDKERKIHYGIFK